MVRVGMLSSRSVRVAVPWVLSVALGGPAMRGQTPAPVASPDAKVVESPAKPKTPAELKAEAWQLLSDAVGDDKHLDIKIDGLSALGTMGSDARSTKMIVAAFADKDVDVRTAALLAAGQTKDRMLLPAMRKLLDDKEPQVAYAAAVTLWKMGDHSGEDLLMAVVDGDTKANATLVNGAVHSANKELHDPAALAKLGALEGASMLLGPFGFGITAYEYIKKNGGDSARAASVELIAQTHTAAVKMELMGALMDKDQTVRAAAAKALRSYREAEVSRALAGLLEDTKRPVQLVAAASYLISSGAVALPPAPVVQ